MTNKLTFVVLVFGKLQLSNFISSSVVAIKLNGEMYSIASFHRAFSLDTPGREMDEDWQKTAEEVQKSAALFRDTIDQTHPVEGAKRKAKSAKSHIFRKDKVAAEYVFL